MATSGITHKHILIVEDEIYIALDLQAALSEAGATTAQADTSNAAIELVQRSRFDAAILDVHLRDESTYAVADELRRQGIPFVFLSGYLTVREGYADIPFLTKPYTRESVRTAVGDLLTTANRP